MRIAASKRSRSPKFLDKLSKSQPSGIKVEVTDMKTKTSAVYHAIRYIEHYIYLKQDKPVLDRYTFKLVSLNSDEVGTNLVNKKKVQKISLKMKAINVETKEITIYSSISAAARALG